MGFYGAPNGAYSSAHLAPPQQYAGYGYKCYVHVKFDVGSCGGLGYIINLTKIYQTNSPNRGISGGVLAHCLRGWVKCLRALRVVARRRSSIDIYGTW